MIITDSKATPDLKNKVVSGMAVLFLRHVIGLLISIASVALIYKGVTAKEYGLIVLSQSIWFYVCTVTSLGIDVFIIKESEHIDDNFIAKVFFLQILSLLIGYFFVSAFIWWVNVSSDSAFPRVASLVGISYVIRNLALVPNSRLESQLNYAPSGLAEIKSQVIYVVTLAILFAFHFKTYAICVAMIVSSSCYTLQIFSRLKIFPKPTRLSPQIIDAVKFGMTTQANTWLWQVKDFAVPQILAVLVGTEFVGILGLVNQITQKLSFIRQIVWRVSLSAISKIKYDSVQLLKSIQFSANTQAAILSIIFLVLGLLIRCIEDYGSPNWKGISQIFPAVALGMLVNGVFSVGCAALMILGELRVLFWFHFIFVSIYIAVVSLAGSMGPLYAFYGAELTACVAYLSLWTALRKVGPLQVVKPLLVALIAVGSLAASNFLTLPSTIVLLTLTILALTATSTVRASLLHVCSDITQLIKSKKESV